MGICLITHKHTHCFPSVLEGFASLLCNCRTEGNAVTIVVLAPVVNCNCLNFGHAINLELLVVHIIISIIITRSWFVN